MDAGEARSIIDRQVEILQHLNDEYYRLVRIHLLIAGALTAAVSLVGPENLLLSRSGPSITWPSFVLWIIGGIAFATGGGYWIHRITEPRIKSADLKLGELSGLPDDADVQSFCDSLADCVCYNDERIETATTNLNDRQRNLNGSILLVILGLLAMLLASL